MKQWRCQIFVLTGVNQNEADGVSFKINKFLGEVVKNSEVKIIQSSTDDPSLGVVAHITIFYLS